MMDWRADLFKSLCNFGRALLHFQSKGQTIGWRARAIGRPRFPLVVLIEGILTSDFTIRFLLRYGSSSTRSRKTNEPVGCSGWSINTRAETTMFDDDNKDAKAVSPKVPAKQKGVSRRAILKAGAAAAGAAVGSEAFRGLPTIWAQEIKDIELRHVGVSYSVVKAIGDQAAKDLGFKVTMQNLDTSAAINRFISQPD